MLRSKIVVGEEVWQWEEFQKLAKRLGIDIKKETKSINIYLGLGDIVTVDQSFMGKDTQGTL